MVLLKAILTAGKSNVSRCSKHCLSVLCPSTIIPCFHSNCCTNTPSIIVNRRIASNSIVMLNNDLLPSQQMIDNISKESSDIWDAEERIIKQFKKYYSNKSKGNFNDALFILGPMGSGKTTVIRDKVMNDNQYKKYAYVDTDELMAYLPDFDENKIELFYPIARRMAIQLTDWLLEERLSFVAEGTCVKYQELIDYMIRLKKTGYHIKVCKINSLPLDVVLFRASNREHRKVCMDLVKDIYLQSHRGIDEIYQVNESKTIFENVVF